MCRFVGLSAVSPRFLRVGPTDLVDYWKKIKTSISTGLTTGLCHVIFVLCFQ